MWPSWRAILLPVTCTLIYLGINTLKQFDTGMKREFTQETARQTVCVSLLVGMLAHQLLTRLQKDKKIGVGVQRTETKPFLYSYCIFYLIMQLLIFFLITMYECIKWSQKIGLAKYLTL